MGLTEYGSLQSAKKVDEFTVDITTKDPDPILPERLVHFAIPAPNWLKTASLETLATQAVGSGPYLLAEYQKGQLPAVQGQPELLGAEQAEDRRDQAGRPDRAGGPRRDAAGR